MKQPYSCQYEVPEGVRWDRKRSPEPNLYVCGEDDMKKAIYNMKESIDKEGLEHQKTQNTEKKALRTKELNLFQKKKLIVVALLIHL